MAVRLGRWLPARPRAPLARHRASEASQEPLRKVMLTNIHAMEKDLQALEHPISDSAKKTDLHRIKRNWGLKSETFGAHVKPQAARQALILELRQQIDDMRKKLGPSEAHGSVLSALAAGDAAPAQESSTVPPLETGRSSARSGRPAALTGLGAGLAFLAWNLWSSQAPEASHEATTGARGGADTQALTPRVVHDAQATTRTAGTDLGQPAAPQAAGAAARASSAASAGAASASSAAMVEATGVKSGPGQVTADPSLKMSAQGEPSRDQSATGPGEVRQQSGEPAAEGALWAKVDPKAVAAVSLAVLGLGLWWIWRSPPGTPPSSPLEPEAAAWSSEVGDAGLTASLRARQAGEVVFENAPKDGQVWDMSASVRGIKGGVQEKINQFQR